MARTWTHTAGSRTRHTRLSAHARQRVQRSHPTGSLRRGLWQVALAASLVFGSLHALVAAQVADAVIEVLAQDESMAVLPGVTVSVTRPDTGFTQTGLTDGSGSVRFPALPPGTYNLMVELQGFSTVEQPDVTVRVGQTARINVTMRVAQVSETVNVIGQVPLVDVFKTDSSTNIVPEQIEALPVPNRDFQQLAFLTPGVQRERGGNRFIADQPVIGAAGNASQATIMIDGVDFTDPVLGLARARFSQEAISEFRVIANRFDPEIGGSAGGALSIITKSGTNTPKGSAFAFFRDDALRAKGELDLQKNTYSRQQFGFTLGGPIVRDRTHFFGSFEQVNLDATVPFRPGGDYASKAADLDLPSSQSLLYGGLDHQATDSQNLRFKLVFERVRQDNFRVGGVADLSAGMDLNRDNFNASATHSWTLGGNRLNQIAMQVGRRSFDEPNNSTAIGEYFSSGNTLQTGANIIGDQKDTGTVFELRDTFFTRVGSGRWAQDLKFGGALQHVTDDWDFPVYPRGLLIYLTDTRVLPLVYVGTTGSGRDKISTNLISGFIQDDIRPSARVSINVGVRYDLDTNGNNRDFTSPFVTSKRDLDANNIQPRVGVSWDLKGNGAHVLRGGAGLFTGRYLLVPAHIENMQNGYTGRIIQQRLNGAVIGLPALALDPNNPSTTGIPLSRDAGGIAQDFVNPYTVQASGGYTLRLGTTGLFADFEGIYVKGEDEVIIRDTNWKGNGGVGCTVAAASCRPNTAFNQINLYTNEGRSEYKAFVTSVNGTIVGGHVITASFTVADRKNINDDFSPALTDYPNDPADIEAEYGRGRADERYRFVASSILRLPARLTLAPIFEYGSGQPWNRRRGYDFNGDGKTSDRLPDVGKFTEDGPDYTSVNLRATYALPVGTHGRADLIAEFFNLFNRTNYDVNSLINAEFLSGPTLQNPAAAFVANPRYKQYTATLTPFEAQLGVRFSF